MLLDIFKEFLQWTFLNFRFIDKETEAQGSEILKGGHRCYTGLLDSGPASLMGATQPH